MDRPTSTSQQYPWRLFWLLFTAAILSALSIIPIASDMLSAVITKVEVPKIPLPVLIAVGVVQNLAILAFAVWLGFEALAKPWSPRAAAGILGRPFRSQRRFELKNRTNTPVRFVHRHRGRNRIVDFLAGARASTSKPSLCHRSQAAGMETFRCLFLWRDL